MPTPTAHYGFPKPTVGGDSDAWGGELNTALDGIDATLFGVSATATAAAIDAASVANFLQAGIGAVTRTGLSKMRDQISILDFYNPIFLTWDPIINAASLAVSVAGGGQVQVPNTIHDVAGSLLGYTGVELVGMGKLSQIRLKAGLVGGHVIMWKPNAIGVVDASMRDITFNHRCDLYPSDGHTPCISIDGTTNFLAERVKVLSAQTMAFWCDSTTANPTVNPTICKCPITGYDSGGAAGTVGGISLFGAVLYAKIWGNHLENHRDDAIAIQDSVNGRPIAPEVFGNTLLNNARRIAGSTPHGILFYGCLGGIAQGNYIDKTVASSIWVGAGAFNDCQDISLIGNTLKNAGISADSVVGVPIAGINILGDRANSRFVDGVTCSGNTIRGPKGNGIQAQDAFNVSITGGSIKACYNNGISYTYVVDSTITGVTIMDNGVSASGVELNGIILFGTSPAVTCDNIVITGNRIGDSRAGGARTQTYALYCVGGANLLNISFDHNNVRNNLIGVIGGAPPLTLVARSNPGLNPQGVFAQGLGASPYTYLNQSLSPMTVYINGGTVNSIVKNALTIAVATNFSFNLEPNESFTMTYASAPLMRVDIH